MSAHKIEYKDRIYIVPDDMIPEEYLNKILLYKIPCAGMAMLKEAFPGFYKVVFPIGKKRHD